MLRRLPSLVHAPAWLALVYVCLQHFSVLDVPHVFTFTVRDSAAVRALPDTAAAETSMAILSGRLAGERLAQPPRNSAPDAAAACAASLSGPLVGFVDTSTFKMASAGAVWTRLQPCFDALRGSVYVYGPELAAAVSSLFPHSREPLRAWLAKYDQYSTDQVREAAVRWVLG